MKIKGYENSKLVHFITSKQCKHEACSDIGTLCNRNATPGNIIHRSKHYNVSAVIFQIEQPNTLLNPSNKLNTTTIMSCQLGVLL